MRLEKVAKDEDEDRLERIKKIQILLHRNNNVRM